MMVRMFNRAITKIHKDNYDLSMVYIDSLKKVAKSHGPNSKEVMDELAVIDEVLQVDDLDDFICSYILLKVSFLSREGCQTSRPRKRELISS